MPEPVQSLANRLGIDSPTVVHDGVDWAHPILSSLAERGANIVFKLDGERPSDQATCVLSGPLLDGEFIRCDGPTLGSALAEALIEYARHVGAGGDRSPRASETRPAGTSETWKTSIDVDGWELTILVPDDYSLITDFELRSPSGDRFLGSAGAPEMVRQLLDGSDPDNDLFWMNDLVLVGELSEASVVAAARRLIGRGEVARALEHASDDGEADAVELA